MNGHKNKAGSCCADKFSWGGLRRRGKVNDLFWTLGGVVLVCICM